LGFRIKGLGLKGGFRVSDFGSWVRGSGFRVQGLGLDQGLAFMVVVQGLGLGFRVRGLGFRA
jgi:hypothetical protein